MNWIFSLFQTGFLLPVVQPAKINFEIDFCRLKIQFVEIDFLNLIFQKSSTDGQGESECRDCNLSVFTAFPTIHMDHRSFSNMSEKSLCQFADCPAGDCLVGKLIDLLIFIRVKKSKFYWHLSIGIFYYKLSKGVVKERFCVIKKSVLKQHNTKPPLF